MQVVRKLEVVWAFLMSLPYLGFQATEEEATCLSLAYRLLITCLSLAYRLLITGLSLAYRLLIACLSLGELCLPV